MVVSPPTVLMIDHSNPGVVVGTQMMEIPLCLGTSGSVRTASQM